MSVREQYPIFSIGMLVGQGKDRKKEYICNVFRVFDAGEV